MSRSSVSCFVKQQKTSNVGTDVVFQNTSVSMFNATVGRIKHALHADNIHSHEDNGYNNRIIDAFARLFYIQDTKDTGRTCCAVTVAHKENQQLCYVSYNVDTDTANIQDEIRALYNIISNCGDYRILINYCLKKSTVFIAKHLK